MRISLCAGLSQVIATIYRPYVLFSERVTLIILLVLGLYVATMNISTELEIVINDKLQHSFVFFWFAVLVDLAFKGHLHWVWSLFSLLCYGLLIECLQYMLPYRSFELFDLLADGAGVVLFFTVKHAVSRCFCSLRIK